MEFRDRRTKKSFSTTGAVVQSDSITSFGINFAIPTGFFVGASFEGSLQVCLNSFIVIRRIVVSLECHIVIEKTTEEEPQTITSTLKSIALNPDQHRRLLSTNYIPFGDEFDFEHRLDEDNFVLQAGSYEYFFEFSIPRDSPPTVRQNHLSISYICSASLECGPMSDTMVECSKLLHVDYEQDMKESSWWNQPLAITEVFCLSNYFPRESNNSGNVSVDIRLNRTGFIRGDGLKLSGTVSNNSELFVVKVDALIVFFVETHSSSRSPSTSIQSQLPVNGSSENALVESPVTSSSLGSIDCSDTLSLNDHPICLPPDHTIILPGQWMKRSLKCLYMFVLRIVFQGHEQLHVLKISLPLFDGDTFSGIVGKFTCVNNVFEI